MQYFKHDKVCRCSKDLLGCMIGSSIQSSFKLHSVLHSHELWFIELGAMMRSGVDCGF